MSIRMQRGARCAFAATRGRASASPVTAIQASAIGNAFSNV